MRLYTSIIIIVIVIQSGCNKNLIKLKKIMNIKLILPKSSDLINQKNR